MYCKGVMSDSREDPYADLADLVLNVSRLIRLRTPTAPEVVSLTATERQVMRVVDVHPGCSPSEIAARTRLQRTNVSTALRGLESKGMVMRSSTNGRGIAVTPTERAQSNLEVLRGAWSGLLSGLLADVDRGVVEDCNRLLGQLERRFSDEKYTAIHKMREF